jgi:hypothetical protein
MLTALPDRLHFEAIGLAGFRVPQKSRAVKAPELTGIYFWFGDLRPFHNKAF